MKYPVSQKQKDLIDNMLKHQYQFQNKKFPLSDKTRMRLVDISIDEFYEDNQRPFLTQIRQQYIQSKIYNKDVTSGFAINYLKETINNLPT